MKLNLEQITRITLGAINVKEDNGVFSFYRFSPEEAKATDQCNAKCTAGIELNFQTDATALNLSVDILSEDTPRSFFAVDIFPSIPCFSRGINRGCGTSLRAEAVKKRGKPSECHRFVIAYPMKLRYIM